MQKRQYDIARYAPSRWKMSADQHLRSQRLSCVLDVRIGHRRVLGHDIHAQIVPGAHVHDSDHRQRRRRIESAPHSASNSRAPPARPRAGSRIHHRDRPLSESPARCLPAQRMESRCRTTDLAGRMTARLGSVRCRCRARAASAMPHRIIEAFECLRTDRATSRIVSAGVAICAIASDCISRRYLEVRSIRSCDRQ